jgi:hypothetical protein
MRRSPTSRPAASPRESCSNHSDPMYVSVLRASLLRRRGDDAPEIEAGYLDSYLVAMPATPDQEMERLRSRVRIAFMFKRLCSSETKRMLRGSDDDCNN